MSGKPTFQAEWLPIDGHYEDVGVGLVDDELSGSPIICWRTEDNANSRIVANPTVNLSTMSSSQPVTKPSQLLSTIERNLRLVAPLLVRGPTVVWLIEAILCLLLVFEVVGTP
jgi:hypothetical protein